MAAWCAFHGLLTLQLAWALGQPLFTNPLDVQVADPCILRVGDTYYLYGTASAPADANTGFPAWSSHDLVRWNYEGRCLKREDCAWGERWFWGPEVVEADGRYLMFYGCFREEEGVPVGRICLAESDSPAGPFLDTRAPLFPWAHGWAIDAFPFRDEDGRAYLYFSSAEEGIGNRIWVAELAPDLRSLATEPALILWPDQPWEVSPVNEGAYVTRLGDTYLLLYSGNDFRTPLYGVGVATAPTPLGPWTKHPANPIVSTADDLKGPGCLGLIASPDRSELLAYYHVHAEPAGYRRALALSRVGLVRHPDGVAALSIAAPTRAPQAWPAGAPVPRPPGGLGSEALDRSLWTVVAEEASAWSFERGRLRIVAADGDMWRGRADYQNLFVQHLPPGDLTASVSVSFDPQANYEQAFLILWQDQDNYIRLSTGWADGPALLACSEARGEFHEARIPNPFAGTEVRLRMLRTGSTVRCFVEGPDGSTVAVGEECVLPLLGPRIGIGAISPGSGAPQVAEFWEFAVQEVARPDR